MIDNPDQRIVDDLNSFAGSTIGFALALFNAVINLISFSGILYSIYPPLFFVCLVYSIGGTFISVLLGKVSADALKIIFLHFCVHVLSLQKLMISFLCSLSIAFIA